MVCEYDESARASCRACILLIENFDSALLLPYKKDLSRLKLLARNIPDIIRTPLSLDKGVRCYLI